ncbi:MAG: hypothetical protein JO137_20310 [Hyphomicrobiales bacterium]|nr:hypothetical protein [Hyphomicrobiales bacterium]
MVLHEHRATNELHLSEAEAHVAEGMRHVENQREIIANLERGGHDTFEAEWLLRTFEDTLAMHVAHRDRLRKELDHANLP